MEYISQLQQAIHQAGHSDFKALYGNNPEKLLRNSSAWAMLLDRFAKQFGHEKAALFSVPGRTEVGGNHTDHNHGCVLAAAVDLDNIAVAAANNSKFIRILSAGYPVMEISTDVTDVVEAEKHTSAALVRGIVARMQQLGYKTGGFDACIDGRVPKGSGLSSSASFEVLIGTILNHVFNAGEVEAIQLAKIGQYAENVYFGKPCGLMDQTACAVGGFITIDFKDPASPKVKKLDFDFETTGYQIVITDTGGDHAHLSDEYASLPREMKQVAEALGGQVQRDVSLGSILANMPTLRSSIGDRALLRAIHFQRENLRVGEQVKALELGNFSSFLGMVIDSGRSSYMYNQNVYLASDIKSQPVALGLAVSEILLQGHGAWRVHGGGFAGTIQAFVPEALLDQYIGSMEQIFGKGSCLTLKIRDKGACMLAVGC